MGVAVFLRAVGGKGRCFLLMLLMLPAVVGVGAVNQVSAQPPTPGEVGDTMRPTVDINTLMEQPPPAVPLTPPPPVAPPPADEKRVRVNHFEFSGNSLFSDAELQEVVKEFAGQDLTLADIYQVADRLSDFFQEQGYNLTTATVPAQRMRGGVLRLEIVEGKVGKVLFSGNRRYSAEYLAAQVAPVRPGTIVRFADLERQVLLLNDLPGLVARSVMLPGADFGTTDLQLTVEENPVAASVTVDNHGLEVVGKWRVATDVTFNNPLEYGDVLGLGYTHSQSGLLRQGRINYGLPLGTDGWRLNMNYARAEYDVGKEFSRLNISGISETARVQITYPQIRSRRTNLNWVVGGARVRGSSDIDNISLSDDTIVYLEAGLNVSHRHDHGGSSTFSTLVATNFRSNEEGDDNKALPPRVEIRGSYEHPFAGVWSVLVKGEAVWAADPMPDSNKYSLGGPASVRGFVSSMERGDQGGMGSLELRRLFVLEPLTLQARAFVDAGVVNSRSVRGFKSSSKNLKSAGFGLTTFAAGRYLVDAVWAKPIGGDASGEERSSQLWVTLSAMF